MKLVTLAFRRWTCFPIAIALLAIVVSRVDSGELPADWVYRPVARPSIPRVASSADNLSPIDRFLLTKLEVKGLGFSPLADQRTLIRRVTLDLTGLPPTLKEIDEFLNDHSPNAYEHLVERLLASPAYGERQALFWLDLVRYAESDGFKADDLRPDAWRYRDYVIHSFNEDKPYDRFIREQLAADELAPDDLATMPATGFLRHYPDENNAVNLEQRRQEILNDITDTTATAFLGITLGCAKCHDHKTDPLTQADYYRFQAFFAGLWPVERPVMTDGEKKVYEARRNEWEKRTANSRSELKKLEEPYRKREFEKQRMRFQEEYTKLLDMPFAERTPIQRQIGAMIEKQVDGRVGDISKNLKPGEKERWQAVSSELKSAAKELPPEPPRAMVMTDVGPVCPPTYLLKRGDWRKPDDELVPGFPASIDDRDADVKPTATTSGRRMALANWIADAKNPLTARVMVNRLWQQHFGRGLVGSSGDLGVTGDRPTHPELLDWLAAEFVGRGWSIKRVHQLIVTSHAYRQSSVMGGETKLDPDNKLLSRFPRWRLDGEAVRDAILATAGILNPKAGGPSIFPEIPSEIKPTGWKVTPDLQERNRRSIYVAVKRNLRYPLFSLFDSPERNETCSRRFVTTTAPQALMLLNDSLILSGAKSFAARLLKESGSDRDTLIERGFVIALCRLPTTEEHDAMKRFLESHRGTPSEAVVDLAHAILNLNEFLYID